MTRLTRRNAVAALAALAAPPALAQGSGPLRLVVPFPPGGTMDVQARVLAPILSERLGMAVIVENKPGAGTVIATQEVARATPEQPTLLMVANSFTIAPSLQRNLTYDIFRDFQPIALVSVIPHALIVHPSLPAQNVAEFLALARARPGELHYATPGIGTSNHLNIELVARRAGVSFTHVPYRGFAQWFPDLLANRIQFTIAALPEVVPPSRDGRVRLLAVAHEARLPSLPDVPTLGEAGGPAMSSNTWFAFLMPASTPDALRRRVEAEVLVSLRQPGFTTLLADQSATLLARDSTSLAAFLRTEHANYAEAIRLSGARVE